MTPKEKAKELVDKYIDLSDECDCLEYSCICFTMYEYKAKKCALIAVDEIIKSNPTKVTENAVWFKLNIEYWQEVKQEIKKL